MLNHFCSTNISMWTLKLWQKNSRKRNLCRFRFYTENRNSRPGNICPYQEHLSCYRLNFDQTLNIDSKKKFWLQFQLDLEFSYPKFFWTQNVLDLFFWPNIILDPTLLGWKFFGHGLFLDQNFFESYFFDKNKNNNNNNHNHKQNFNGVWHNWN